jgi:hypothetical protein
MFRQSSARVSKDHREGFLFVRRVVGPEQHVTGYGGPPRLDRLPDKEEKGNIYETASGSIQSQ